MDIEELSVNLLSDDPAIGLRAIQPAGLHELTEGKIDALIERSLGHHPGYRCDRLAPGQGVGEHLICPEGTADCQEIVTLRDWFHAAADAAKRFPRLASSGD